MNQEPRLWVIRANDGLWAEGFANNGYIGLDHGMDGVDLSRVRSGEEVKRLYVQEHPSEINQQGISNHASQVRRFHLEIKAGDYVLTPGLDRDVRCGRFTSDATYYVSGSDGLPCRNRRRVKWVPTKLSRDEFAHGTLSGGTALYEVSNADRLRKFFDVVGNILKPKVWVGIAQANEFDVFRLGNRFGLKLGLDKHDLSRLVDRQSIEKKFAENPEPPEPREPGTITTYSLWWERFLIEMDVGDFILMPSSDQSFVYFGQVMSAPTYDSRRVVRNSREVEWNETPIPTDILNMFPIQNRSSLAERILIPDAALVDSFFEIINGMDDDPDIQEKYTVKDMIKDGVFFDEPELQRILGRFEDKKNLILQGPPGVGKTFVSKRLSYALMGEQTDDRIVNVQFHQSYSYEEFVRGFRPDLNGRGELIFKLQPGAFLRFCDEARKHPVKKFPMIIDEINRGNLSRVFGELLSLIEKDKRGGKFKVELLGGDEFSVPENVYLLGTMNLADRSLAGTDYAMRRRFAFVTLEPQFGKAVFEEWLTKRHVPSWIVDQINDRMSELNRLISDDDRSLGPNFVVGHSYFCDISDGVEDWNDGDWDRWYREIVKTEIQPLLEEYWFDDPKKAGTEVKKLLGEEA